MDANIRVRGREVWIPKRSGQIQLLHPTRNEKEDENKTDASAENELVEQDRTGWEQVWERHTTGR